MKYILCAAVEARVYAEISADSFEEALQIQKDENPEWKDEEWVSTLKLVNITNATGETRDL